MVQSLSSRDPLLGLPLQQLAHEIDAIACDLLILFGLVVQLAFLILVEDGVPALAGEGLLADQQDVHDYAHAEGVDVELIDGLFFVVGDDLRRHEAWSAALCEDDVLLVVESS